MQSMPIIATEDGIRHVTIKKPYGLAEICREDSELAKLVSDWSRLSYVYKWAIVGVLRRFKWRESNLKKLFEIPSVSGVCGFN